MGRYYVLGLLGEVGCFLLRSVNWQKGVCVCVCLEFNRHKAALHFSDLIV